MVKVFTVTMRKHPKATTGGQTDWTCGAGEVDSGREQCRQQTRAQPETEKWRKGRTAGGGGICRSRRIG